MEVDPLEADQQLAPADAQSAPVANPQLTDSWCAAPQAPECAGAPAPLALGSPTDMPALECATPATSSDPAPVASAPRGLSPKRPTGPSRARPDVGPVPEPPQEDRPYAVPTALTDEAPSANAALQPPPTDVDASQGTATQLANLMGDVADGFSPLRRLTADRHVGRRPRAARRRPPRRPPG